MPYTTYLAEFRDRWFPHVTDEGLRRLIELLEQASPLLIHGAFTKSIPMGCLATHIAWHHPKTARLTQEAGIIWLSRIAGLNPATSQVVRIWDETGINDWGVRTDLLSACKEEAKRRANRRPYPFDFSCV